MTAPTQSNRNRGQGIAISFFRSMRGRLSIWFLILSFLPLTVMRILAYPSAQGALQQQAFNQLVAVRKIKAHQIEAFFRERASDARTLSQNPTTVTAVKDLAAAFASLGAERARSLYLDDPSRTDAGDGSDYSAAHARYHPVFSHYAEEYEYYDLFLVEPQNGYVVYTVAKEEGYGTSLLSGPFAETNTADAFKEAIGATDPGAAFLVDFQEHEHEHEQVHGAAAASFIASPIYDGAQPVGVLIFQIPIDRLNAIMTERAGMGETGETFLVGADKLMRSDSRFTTESTILQREVDTTCVEQALAGGTGTMIVADYRGVPVLSAFQPLDIQDLDWVILAEIDKAEAFAPARALLTILLSIGAVTLAIVVAVAFLVARQLSSPLMAMADVASRVAAGNLEQTVEVSAADETGVLARAFNRMIGNLHYLLERIGEASLHLSASSEELAAILEQMNVSSEQIAVTVSQMAQGAATQARRAEETSHSVAQLATATSHIADNAHRTGEASTQARRSVRDSAQVVQVLGDKLNEIEQIVTLVDKIAAQTNLLSLNASIEAARAGEHGLGFAVVADEVRRLADHSAASVGQIAALSQEIGSRLDEMRAAMEEAQVAVAQTAILAQETAVATKEQEEASETMVNAVNEMAAVTEENAASNEEIAASVEEQLASLEQVADFAQALAQMANSLQQTVSEFTKGDFEGCARKKIKDAGEPVPPSLLPDGSDLA